MNSQGVTILEDVIRITDVRFVSAPSAEQDGGLLGWISANLGGSLRIDGLALRKTADGRLALSFPARRDGAGRQRFILKPLSNAARLQIERQIFHALGFLSDSKTIREEKI